MEMQRRRQQLRRLVFGCFCVWVPEEVHEKQRVPVSIVGLDYYAQRLIQTEAEHTRGPPGRGLTERPLVAGRSTGTYPESYEHAIAWQNSKGKETRSHIDVVRVNRLGAIAAWGS
jgi:hypothetical protein